VLGIARDRAEAARGICGVGANTAESIFRVAARLEVAPAQTPAVAPPPKIASGQAGLYGTKCNDGLYWL
jgi:hypothetical protein